MKKFKKFFPGRKLLIAKEISKLHEFFYRENVDSINMFKTTLKGELTVVISQKNIKDKILDEKKIIKKAKIYLKKYSLKDGVELLFESEKINKKKIYQICLDIKKKKETLNDCMIPDFIEEKIIVDEIDYYYSNVVARASKTMSECRNSKINVKRTGTEG